MASHQLNSYARVTPRLPYLRPLDGAYAAVFIDALVRHEALCIRVEVGDLHRLAVAATEGS
jgi:hypothetical protein